VSGEEKGAGTAEAEVVRRTPPQPMAKHNAPSLADYGLLLLLAAIWGGSFFLIKIGVASVPALTLTAIRLLVASAAMVAIAVALGERVRGSATTWVLIVLAAFTGNALPFTLISWGEERIDSGLAALLMAIMPLTTYLLAHFATRDEKLNGLKTLGIALGLFGVVVLIGPGKLARLGEDTMRQLAVVAAALCYGLNALIARKLVGVPRYALVAALMVISLLMIGPAALVLDTISAIEPTGASVAAIVILGVVQTALGTMLMFALVARQGASFFSQINFLVPLFGVAWGALILAEIPSANALLALMLILAGIAAARRGATP